MKGILPMMKQATQKYKAEHWGFRRKVGKIQKVMIEWIEVRCIEWVESKCYHITFGANKTGDK